MRRLLKFRPRHLPLIQSLALVALLAASAGAAKEADAGAHAGNVLLRGDVGARAAGMGGAFIAISNGADAVRYNPAALAEARRYQVLLQRQNLSYDIDANAVALSTPFGIGLGVSQVDYGRILRTTTVDKSGLSGARFGADDLLLRLAYGRDLSDRLALGASAGWYRLKIDTYEASGTTLDLAFKYRPSWEGTTIAGAIRNLGQKARFLRTNESLPTALVVGASYLHKGNLLFSAEYEQLSGRSPLFRFGTEYMPLPQLALRLGYDMRNDAGEGFTAGLGFEVRDVDFDYAFVPMGDLGQSHRFALSWDFGRERAEAEREGNLPARKGAAVSTAPVVRPVAVEIPPPAARIEPPTPTRTVRNIRAEVRVAAEAAVAGRLDEADETLRRLCEENPDDREAHSWRGAVLYMKKEWAGTATFLEERCLNRWPDDTDAWVRLGNARFRLGNRAGAIAAWSEALDRDPANKAARSNLDAVQGGKK